LSARKAARLFRVRGRVQGVGFRSFVEREANALGLAGWVRNTDDDGVEVYAAGPPAQLSELAALLWKGPRLADVRGVEESEAPLEDREGFIIRY
jgi:acylphosphatase